MDSPYNAGLVDGRFEGQAMISEVTCPDCGGVVGATEPTEAGPPCRCFADMAPSASDSSITMSGTMAGGDPSDVTADAPLVAAKVCRLCGKDLVGHRRVKDGTGYLCVACYKEEEKRANYGRVPCKVCGKLTAEEKLTDYEGTKMCPSCHEGRITMRRQEIKRMGFKAARFRDDSRQLLLVLVIGGVLLAIILAGVLINHFRH